MFSANRVFKNALCALMSLFITGCILVGALIVYVELQLPDVKILQDYQLQTPLKIYTSDGKLIAEFGQKRRNPVSINQVPQLLIDAILATEDQRYYEHPGVDPLGLLRAAVKLLTTGTKSQGGSTITMQVARNYFLSPQKTFTRKFREILLAIKIDSEFSKEKVLELYLNKIYLGNRAYGVAAAAQVYYGKSLQQLTLPEMAMLAGLPKAPSSLNPLANPSAALDRRNFVLQHMYSRHYITKKQYLQAINTPLTASYHGEPTAVNARYVAEMVNDGMIEYYGDKAYTEGFKVYTTINSANQHIGNRALTDALIAYDKRHGYRGPEANWGRLKNNRELQLWEQQLSLISPVNQLKPAVVTTVSQQSATVFTASGDSITLPWDGLKWAFRYNNNYAWGAKPKTAADILKVGDLVRIIKSNTGEYSLAQIPQVEGALIALNPSNGAIVSLVGGFDYSQSNYNRVIQAERQPGSGFKPFIYAAALAKGYTLASVVNDAPIVVDNPGNDSVWRPENDTKKFYGPTRLRVALMESRNLASIRLLRDIQPSYAVKFAALFGFDPNKLPPTLSLALGTGVVTPLELATGYAVFANGGYKVQPYLISRIVDSNGKVVYQAEPKTVCTNCTTANTQGDHYPIPPFANAQPVLSPQIAYLMTSALQSVIKNGTAIAARVLNRQDLAGKTGTTNEQMDAWFTGFNSDIVTSCWVGFDEPQNLHEYGDQAALPMWINFMGQVLQGKPEHSMPQPTGIVTVKIDQKTGLLASANDPNAIYEIFREGYVPKAIATATSGDAGAGNGSMQEDWAAPLY